MQTKSEELEKALVVPTNPEEATLAAQKSANVQLTVELRNAQRYTPQALLRGCLQYWLIAVVSF